MESPDLLDLTVLLAAILHRAEKWIGTQHGYLCLLNRNQNKMEIVYGTGAATPYGDPFISYDEGLAGKVWSSGEVLVVEDYALWSGRINDERTRARPLVNAAVGVPILVKDEVVGVIGLFHTEKARAFTADEIAFFKRMGETAGTVLLNAVRSAPTLLDDHIRDFHEAVPEPDSPILP